ncbi:Fic family protein [Parasphaerochaeta coccoides]|uniref:Fic family protein n=1 Tax=Parasphaerochaeta coccoides TaxID=273376 RepID=UPI0002F2295F
MHPVVLAAEVHIRFVGIHPFCDGNGRVSRLLTNTVLMQHKYLPMAVPQIRKHEYGRDLDIAHGDGNHLPFTEFIAEMTLMTHRDYMRMLRIPEPERERDIREIKA